MLRDLADRFGLAVVEVEFLHIIIALIRHCCDGRHEILSSCCTSLVGLVSYLDITTTRRESESATSYELMPSS